MPASIRRSLPAIDVAVTILRDASGRVLLAERLPRQLSAGYWELPGGKVDAGETPMQAAAREAAEEVGINVTELRPLAAYEHVYPLRRLRLHFYLATRWSGEPHGREGQRIAWTDPARPAVHPLLPSNHRALALLALPEHARALPSDRVTDALVNATGERTLFIVRTRRETRAMAQHALRPALAACARAGDIVFIEDDLQLASAVGAHGVFTTAPAHRWSVRPDVGLWAVRCRNTDEMAAYARLGADIAVVPFDRASESALAAARLTFAGVYVEASIAETSLAKELALRSGARGVIMREACQCACTAQVA